MIEALEDRRLCSGATRHTRVVVNVYHGTLSVSGSTGDDVIVLGNRYDRAARVDLTTANVNGRVYEVRKTVNRFVVYGGAGGDHISVTNRTPTFMDGGTGNDTLECSLGDNTLFGGAGDDVLTREDGYTDTPCYMDGGPGDDRLNFGTTLYGGSGYDVADFNPSASSDYPNYPYNPMTVVGGMEKSDVQSPSLGSRGGNYLFVYKPDGYHDQSISGPIVRADGKVAITVVASFDEITPQPAGRIWRVQVDARYTALSQRRGLVLSFVNPAGQALGESPLLVSPQS